MSNSAGYLLQKGARWEGPAGTGPGLDLTHQVVCPGIGPGPSRGRGAVRVGSVLFLKTWKQTVLSTEGMCWAEMKRRCLDLSSLAVAMGKSSNFSEAGLNYGPPSDHIPQALLPVWPDRGTTFSQKQTMGRSPYLSPAPQIHSLLDPVQHGNSSKGKRRVCGPRSVWPRAGAKFSVLIISSLVVATRFKKKKK